MAELIDKAVISQMEADLGEETCLMLTQLFIDEMASLHSKLLKAFAEKDDKAVAEATHIIKNSAALYGAMSLAKAATDINTRLTVLGQTLKDVDSTLLPLMEDTLQQYKCNPK